jgi:hypothetical protein
VIHDNRFLENIILKFITNALLDLGMQKLIWS